MDAFVYDLDGQPHTFRRINRVSFVNQDSYGPGDRIGSIEDGKGETVLVVNVNGITAAHFDT